MKLKYLDSKLITDFPSGSAIEYYNEQLYLVGDDASNVLVLSKNWKELRRISLFESDELRIAKETKPDFESSTIIETENSPVMLIVGSGSNPPYRNKAYLVSLDKNDQNQLAEHDLTVFFNRISANGISELNIEATATIKDQIIFCNRANQTNRLNELIITDTNFWKNQDAAPIVILPLDLPDNKNVAGVSGLTYSEKNDWLIFSASTEFTSNAFDDGAIGDSYLGVIENASRKIGRKSMKVNEYINLPDLHKKFNKQKVESVCIQTEKNGRVKLHLTADNDAGNTMLFKVRLKD